MERIVKFYRGYDGIEFPCRFDKKCVPSNSRGRHGMEIGFYVKGGKGVVQFKLSTGWLPFKVEKDRIGYRDIPKDKFLQTYPSDLGYYSYTPLYEGQSHVGSCDWLEGKDCYYGESVLNANDAYYTFVNGGEDELWRFLEEYYKRIFEGGEYPEVTEYQHSCYQEVVYQYQKMKEQQLTKEGE